MKSLLLDNGEVKLESSILSRGNKILASECSGEGFLGIISELKSNFEYWH
ncbi:hypothetical protein M388_02945 [Mesotoga sp. Brook.08.YT.4.2.5.4.]|nr:hypothetical protein M388_02945 [Mesotoga sp. Brook.08.YT.4.2.5.4.]